MQRFIYSMHVSDAFIQGDLQKQYIKTSIKHLLCMYKNDSLPCICHVLRFFMFSQCFWWFWACRQRNAFNGVNVYIQRRAGGWRDIITGSLRLVLHDAHYAFDRQMRDSLWETASWQRSGYVLLALQFFRACQDGC